MKRIISFDSGRGGYLLVGASVIGYVALSLMPFRWNPPRRVVNGATLLATGTVQFSDTGMARSSNPPSWLFPVEKLESLEIRLRVRSFAADQLGPARIFTISKDHYLRNLTIAQEHSDLIVRLRTLNTSLDGEPHYTVHGVFAKPAWRLIDLNIKSAELEILVDGKNVLRDDLPRNPLLNWNAGYRLALGNELTWARPWLGQISEATVTVSGQLIDYLKPGQLEYPEYYWTWRDRGVDNLLETLSWSGEKLDIALNFICFVPLGFLVFAVQGNRGSVLFTAVFWGAISFAVELAQIGFDQRIPSPLDWSLNLSGAILGALLASQSLFERPIEVDWKG